MPDRPSDERHAPRMPWSNLTVVMSILAQLVTLVWFAATQSERLSVLNESVKGLQRRVEQMSETQVTTRDLEAYRRQLEDHEQRLRNLERRLFGPPDRT